MCLKGGQLCKDGKRAAGEGNFTEFAGQKMKNKLKKHENNSKKRNLREIYRLES